MKSVLISIQPKWCELIANGKKTVEVRKSRPQLETPFKCYIYATKPKKFIKGYADDDLFRHIDGRIECGFSYQLATEKGATVENNILSSKVIGEFVCDKVESIFNVATTDWNLLSGSTHEYHKELVRQACLTEQEVHAYAKDRIRLYCWHISDLKVYDTPKELGEFARSMPLEKAKIKVQETFGEYDCCHCVYHQWTHDENGVPDGEKCILGKPEPICEPCYPLTRPPQSWCYVEEL